MNFLKSCAFSSLLIVVGIASCGHKPTTNATTTTTTVDPRFQAAQDRNKIELLKATADRELRDELLRCYTTNPKHQRKSFP